MASARVPPRRWIPERRRFTTYPNRLSSEIPSCLIISLNALFLPIDTLRRLNSLTHLTGRGEPSDSSRAPERKDEPVDACQKFLHGKSETINDCTYLESRSTAPGWPPKQDAGWGSDFSDRFAHFSAAANKKNSSSDKPWILAVSASCEASNSGISSEIIVMRNGREGGSAGGGILDFG